MNRWRFPPEPSLISRRKPVVLSDNDKVRLRDLFNEVVKALDNPPLPGPNAAELRDALKADLKSGAVFKQVETILTATAGELSLDEYIEQMRQAFKLPKKGPKL